MTVKEIAMSTVWTYVAVSSAWGLAKLGNEIFHATKNLASK